MLVTCSTPVKQYIEQHIESIEAGNLFEFFGNAEPLLPIYYKELVDITFSAGIDSKDVRKQLLFDVLVNFYTKHPETLAESDIVYKVVCHFGLTLSEFAEVMAKARSQVNNA